MTGITDERLLRYVNRYFQRSGETEFPTVARCARSLGWRQSVVQDIAEGRSDLFMLTSYVTCPPMPIGEHYVETWQ